ncbi:MAG: hypothetical protein K0M69_17230 [Youngiibacter sp.]|nr:hypothetical protein [Youngiibacter sp.]
MNKAIKGESKSDATLDLIGCTPEHLRGHIESQFEDGMTWETYGRWHVDHIIPCSAFDLSNPVELKRCFNYKNLRPLWAEQNLRKSNKIPHRR